MNNLCRKDKAVGIVHPIDDLTLDEEEIRILTNAVKQIQNKRNQEFENSLKQAKKIVASWPKWKRDLARRI